MSVGKRRHELIITVQTLSSAVLTCSCDADGRTVHLTMEFPDEPKILRLAQEAENVSGAAEFFGPLRRSVVLPEDERVDPDSKMIVHDRADGIVTIRFDKAELIVGSQ